MQRKYIVLSVLFCVCLVAANLFEAKIFELGPLTLTGGFLIFPISYIINDCLSEVYGYKNTRFVIWTAFAVNAFVVLCAQIVRVLPGASFWNGQEHFDYIFSAELRITVASMAAFLAGSLMNARIMGKMKERDGEKRFCWRAVLSSLAGESIDSVIFFPIAFWGLDVRHLLIIMLTQVVLKTFYEIIILPFTSRFIVWLREN